MTELNINEMQNTSGGNPILVGVALAVAGWTIANWPDIKQGVSDAINLK